jgi:hypothetical protein
MACFGASGEWPGRPLVQPGLGPAHIRGVLLHGRLLSNFAAESGPAVIGRISTLPARSAMPTLRPTPGWIGACYLSFLALPTGEQPVMAST